MLYNPTDKYDYVLFSQSIYDLPAKMMSSKPLGPEAHKKSS